MSLLPTMGGGSWPLRFPAPVSSQLKDASVQSSTLLKGFVSEDCLISVVYSGPHVEVLNPNTGERVAAWTFSSSSNQDYQQRKAGKNEATSATSMDCEITACIDMSTRSGERSLDGRFLCIGLGDGRVCLFNIFSSRVIRCLNLSNRITSLQCLASPSSAPRYLCEELLLMSGLIAVGTQEGHVYLVDCNIDDDLEASDESSPCQPCFTTLAGGAEKVAQQRTKAMQRGQHLCVALHDLKPTKKRSKVFSFTDTSSGETVHFPDSGVIVSGLCFVPQIGGLLVGYNFGAWQFWNVSAVGSPGRPVSLEYSSPYVSEALPVIGFCFQEPENDPRNFVYVWALRGENDLDSEEEKEGLSNLASIALHALAFQNRDDHDTGVLYSGLMSCQQRFLHHLDSATEHEIKGSLCLGGSTLPLSAPGHHGGHSGRKDMSELEDNQVNLGLCTFLWEVIRSKNQGQADEEENARFFLGIFDLNAWYQAQMPDDVVIESSSQCSYFSVCALDETLLVDDETANVLDCRIDLSSVSRYKSAINVEQHFYPSSLAFSLVCLLDFGIVHAAHLGLQRKVLLELRSVGKDNLVEPAKLYSVCVVAGLVPPETNFEDNDVGQQRCSLLTVALDHHLVDFLKTCLLHWSDGKYSDAGCTMEFFLNWAWNRVASIKQSVDKDTIALFDHSCMELPDATRTTLVLQCRQLQHLKVLFEEAMTLAKSSWRFASTKDSMVSKCQIIELIKLYAEAILWFLNAGLLPEKASPSFDEFFPASDLESLYFSKRQRLASKVQHWLKNNHFLDGDMKGVGLLIDGLCQQLGSNLTENFEREGGNGSFPPPSLHALLICYLIDTSKSSNSAQMAKHRIVQYLFLDMASCLSKKEAQNDEEMAIVENLIKYPSAFSVPPSIIKLTQAYWLLDNEDFDEAVAMLLDPLVHSSDISEEEHRSIMMGLLTQGHPKLALKYCNVRKPPQRKVVDIQLQIAILLANAMVHDAFQLMRLKRSQSGCEELFNFFLVNAEKMDKLGLILQLNLTLQEDQYLTAFLKRSPVQSSQEILLEYFLQRARYQEATQLNQELKSRYGAGGQTRQAIIDRYAKLIPSMMLRDAPKSNWVKPNIMHPMVEPTAIKLSHFNALTPVFKASAIESQFEHKAESLYMTTGAQDPITPFRPKSQRVFGMTGLFNNQPEKSSFIGKKFKEVQDDDVNENPALSLLSTPSIVKKKMSRRSFASKLDESQQDGGRCHTPQSILKVKRLIQTEEENNSSYTSDDKNDQVEQELPRRSDSRVSRESTPGKSLRFNVPKRLPPPIELDDSKSSSSSDLEILEPEQPEEVQNDEAETESEVDIVMENEPQADVEVSHYESAEEETPAEEEQSEVEDVEEDEIEVAHVEQSVVMTPASRERFIKELVAETAAEMQEEPAQSDNESDNEDFEVENVDQTVAPMTPASRDRFIKQLVAEDATYWAGTKEHEESNAEEVLVQEEEIQFEAEKTVAMTPASRDRFVKQCVAEDAARCAVKADAVSNQEDEAKNDSDVEFEVDADKTQAMSPASRDRLLKELLTETAAAKPNESKDDEITFTFSQPSVSSNEKPPQLFEVQAEPFNFSNPAIVSPRKSVQSKKVSPEKPAHDEKVSAEKSEVSFTFRQPTDQGQKLSPSAKDNLPQTAESYAFSEPDFASPKDQPKLVKTQDKLDASFDFSRPKEASSGSTEKPIEKDVDAPFSFAEPVSASNPTPDKRVVKKSQKLLEAIETETILKKSPQKYTKFLERSRSDAQADNSFTLQISSSEAEEEDVDKSANVADETVALSPASREKLLKDLLAETKEEMEKVEHKKAVVEKSEVSPVKRTRKPSQKASEMQEDAKQSRTRRASKQESTKEETETLDETKTRTRRASKKEQEKEDDQETKTEEPAKRTRRVSKKETAEESSQLETEVPKKRGRRPSKKEAEDQSIVETTQSEAEEPKKRGRRPSKKGAEDQTIVETTQAETEEPKKRGRRPSKKESGDVTEPPVEQAEPEQTPATRRSRRNSQKQTPAEELQKSEETTETSAVRRSRRLSGASDDGKKTATRASTPRSAARKTPKGFSSKAIPMDPLVEDEDEKAEEALMEKLTKSGRKRRLSEAPKLDIIPEEASGESSPRKTSRKSVSATAVLQRTPMSTSRGGRRSSRSSKVVEESVVTEETHEPEPEEPVVETPAPTRSTRGKQSKSTKTPSSSSRSTRSKSIDTQLEAIDEQDPVEEPIPEEPSTSEEVKPTRTSKRKSVSATGLSTRRTRGKSTDEESTTEEPSALATKSKRKSVSATSATPSTSTGSTRVTRSKKVPLPDNLFLPEGYVPLKRTSKTKEEEEKLMRTPVKFAGKFKSQRPKRSAVPTVKSRKRDYECL